MALRPRQKANRPSNENISGNDFKPLQTDAPSSKKYSKQSKLIRCIQFVSFLILTAGALYLAFFLGSKREKEAMEREMAAKAVKKKMELAVHWAGGPVTLTKDGDQDADACIILAQCFNSYHFVPDPVKFPENPYKTCHSTIRSILRAFDSGFYFDGPRLVGFISSDFDNSNSFSQISLYNICVRKEERGKGIAKAMIPEYIKAVAAKRASKNVPRVYIGLDVDFDTESAVAAFALYAKMGFNRWWEPCSSIARFDFNTMERQLIMANPPPENNNDAEAKAKTPSFIFPMSQLMLRRKEALKKQIFDSRGTVFTHFCMVMLMGADDFGTVGVDIKDAVQSALKSKVNQ